MVLHRHLRWKMLILCLCFLRVLLCGKWDGWMFSYYHSFSLQIHSNWNSFGSPSGNIPSYTQPSERQQNPDLKSQSADFFFFPQVKCPPSLCEGSGSLRRFRAVTTQEDSALVYVVQTSEELCGVFDLKKWSKPNQTGALRETLWKDGILKC